MKKLVVLLLAIFILANGSLAVRQTTIITTGYIDFSGIVTPTIIANCEHRGYTVNLSQRLCVFNEKDSANLYKFFSGEEGVGYASEIKCRGEKEVIYPEIGESCCDGLWKLPPDSDLGEGVCLNATEWILKRLSNIF